MRTIAVVLLLAVPLIADTGEDAWLRYAPPGAATQQGYARSLPAVLSVSGASLLMGSVREELLHGVLSMTGRILRVEAGTPQEPAIMAGTADQLRQLLPGIPQSSSALPADAYWLKTVNIRGQRYILIVGGGERGVLYGAFAFLRKLAMGDSIAKLDDTQAPYAPLRWINQWDNLDGAVERGYGGRSIFWDAGHVRADLRRVSEYGRLLASLGINAIAINNVNADKRILSPQFTPQIARIADALRPWGVQVAVSVDFASPQSLGGLSTFDPLDPGVMAWWNSRADALYSAVPDLAGLVLKADSEGRAGPSAYHRTHADAANAVARAIQPHGGILFYRGFVYDHHMDWNNPKNDRARAAYDNFQPLDGQFDENVIVQIKNGPIDFQVREPVSPLFGALEKTNVALELQITQEYGGQGRQLMYLVPQWKDALDFDLHARPEPTPLKAIAAGKTFGRVHGGYVGVANVGLDINWFGNHLSQANLYGFGRLAWNPNLSAAAITAEWTRLTFGDDPAVVKTIGDLQLQSWRVYENYTGPLGLQTLTDIVGDHYGVAVEASERNGWGQWHRADQKGVGMDRTAKSGTGYSGQYRPAVARVFDSLSLCPDDLLLFFHHVPYTHRLHDGKTVIQYLYDSHYQGAEAADNYAHQWSTLRGKIDDERYDSVLEQLLYQAGQAGVWRDAVTAWFFRASGVPDGKGRVGKHPGRIEAESVTLNGYKPQAIVPWEAASGGQAVTCAEAKCTATWKYDGAAGWFTIDAQYFDIPKGSAHFTLRVNGQTIDDWDASGHNPARKMDASASTRRRTAKVALRNGDEIEIQGSPGKGDPAGLDYVEILP
jgi:alpha-glucuronidase